MNIKTEKYMVYINEIMQNVSNESRLNVLVIHGDYIILEVFELSAVLSFIPHERRRYTIRVNIDN